MDARPRRRTARRVHARAGISRGPRPVERADRQTARAACTRVQRCTTSPDCPARRSGTGSHCAANSPWRSSPERVHSSARCAGRTSAAQVVAANLDTVLVVDSLAGEARLRRVERYLAVAWSSGATPVVVLTKSDLCDDVAATVEQVREDALGVDVLPVSSVTGEGLDDVRALLPAGRDRGDGRTLRRREVQPRERARRRDPRRHGGDPGGRRPGPAHDHRPRAARAARRRAARGHPGDARTRPLRRRRRGGHRLRRRRAAGRRLPVPRLRSTAPSPGARSPPPSTTAGSTPRGYTAWRKLQAEAHRQLLRVDARARAAEKARLRSFHRAIREQPNRLR